MNTEINEKLKTLPDKSGVYIMKSASGEIIYVGKAKNLKNRVRSYFKSYNHPPKVSSMIANVETFEYIITDSELEALVLENNLIKENMPRYNILLKDDKTYPFLKITTKELYPRILFTRKVIKDGSRYFGPYQNSSDLKQLIALVKEIFCLRHCNTEFLEGFAPKRPCLYYQLGQCRGVCNACISPDEYRTLIDKAIEFINGNTAEAENKLTLEMQEASQTLDFERAALCRDKLSAIESLRQKQKITTPNGEDVDAIALYNANAVACIQVFFIRNGKIIGKEHYFVNDTDGVVESVILAEFLRDYYSDSTFIPGRILIQEEIEDTELMEKFISDKAGRTVKIKVPKIGSNAALMRMIESNAKKDHSERELKIMRDITFKNTALTELTALLELDKPPMYIEAYDVSNLGANSSVASMVVYKNGKPCTARYRNFRMKTVTTQDDYASMHEALTRRFTRARSELELVESGELKLEDASFLPLPDVVFVDGGEGHRNSVLDVVNEFSIPVFGIVKDGEHRTRGLIGQNGEIQMDKKSNAFMLLKNIQDEMHRRAVGYLESTQNKKLASSALDLIPGVGTKRKKLLLSKFKSVRKIQNATIEELCSVEGIDAKTAENIYSFFRENNN